MIYENSNKVMYSIAFLSRRRLYQRGSLDPNTVSEIYL